MFFWFFWFLTELESVQPCAPLVLYSLCFTLVPELRSAPMLWADRGGFAAAAGAVASDTRVCFGIEKRFNQYWRHHVEQRFLLLREELKDRLSTLLDTRVCSVIEKRFNLRHASLFSDWNAIQSLLSILLREALLREVRYWYCRVISIELRFNTTGIIKFLWTAVQLSCPPFPVESVKWSSFSELRFNSPFHCESPLRRNCLSPGADVSDLITDLF